MNAPLGKYSVEQFLGEYWQKKPCLIRNALPDFAPAIDADDLAGLACEEMAESRLVTGSFEAADWTVRQGPFTESDFSALPDRDWTLLVQDVEKHYAPLQDLLQRFDFIPAWRLDDLMISFAAAGGSVGPHTDQYDVFLLQATGKRRWQIARSFDTQLLEHCPLNVLKYFDAEHEWVLEPGDVLYLPPNIAHHGVALEPGMTWSVGSRAPSGADLLQGFGEWLAFSDDEGGRYSDPDLAPVRHAGKIDQRALRELRQFMLSCIRPERGIEHFLASFLSRFRLAHEPVAPPQSIERAQLLYTLKNDAGLMRNPWTRLTWIETGGAATLYAAGQAFDCSPALAEALCRSQTPRLDFERLDSGSLETLTDLINRGHFLLISD
jgi:50S ribosomal protein L16 3-hydroxylase